MLTVTNLTKRFGALDVIEDITFTVPANRFVVFIGPSGCGKTTLFNLLTGVVEKDGGTISWRGTARPHLGDHAAYMQQNDLLLPWLTLAENAALPARIAGNLRRTETRQARGLLKTLGLGGFEDYYPGEVSGGMRQRCALARTLMFHRDLVLLDEPLSALDAITRRSLAGLLLRLQTDFEKDILMITHDVEEALLLADEVVVLSRRPMRILRRLPVDLQKPRSIRCRRLVELRERLLAQLQGQLADAPL